MMRRWIRAMAILLALPGQALAHDLGVAQIVISEVDAGHYRLEAKLPARLEETPIEWPAECTVEDQGARQISRLTRLAYWEFGCAREEEISAPLVLRWNREGALVTLKSKRSPGKPRYLSSRNGVIAIDIGEFAATDRSPAESIYTYVRFGVVHILTGFDHLAFVFALFLLASGWRLVKLVTGFTLGHSVTLCLGYLGWVQLPSAPVEVCIALSIAWIYRDVLLRRCDRQTLWLVALFGLLHGLGFAGALAELELPREQVVLALVSFNLGVELGQVMFILALLPLGMVFRRAALLPQTGVPALAYSLGTLGVFWALLRSASFLG